MRKSINKIKTWLALWPGTWAAPLTILAIVIMYYVVDWINGTHVVPPMGTLDLGTLLTLIFTVAVLVILNEAVFLGIEHNDKELWQYYKRKFDARLEKTTTDKSDEQDFNQITAWQRLKLLFFWRGFLLALGVWIFQTLT